MLRTNSARMILLFFTLLTVSACNSRSRELKDVVSYDSRKDLLAKPPTINTSTISKPKAIENFNPER